MASILAAAPALAQAPAVRGPVLGYVFDSGAIRPVPGIPGAALLGQALDLGGSLDRAVISPRQDLALAVASSDSRVLIVSLPSGEAKPCECEPGPDRIIFSPNGNAAALYYTSDSSVRVLHPGGTAPTGAFDLSFLPGQLTALAVSDDGAVLAASSGAVYFIASGGAPRLMLSASRASALAFFPASTDALVTDDLDNRVYVVRDPAGSAAASVVAASADGIDGPAAVRAAGNSRVLTASSRTGAIVITDLTAGISSTTKCGCALVELEPLNASAYRLTAGPGPIWVLDDGVAGPRAVFIPPDVPAPAKAGQP